MYKKLMMMAAALMLSVMVFGQEMADQLVVSVTPAEMTEGEEARFTVALASAPQKEVTVKVRSFLLDRLVVQEGALLTFNEENWETPQSVVVKAVDDNISNGEQQAEVTLLAMSKEKAFNDCKRTLLINVKDNDQAGISITPNPIELNKQMRTGSIFVKLTTQPTSEVNVVVRSTDSNVSLTGNTMTFNALNWNVLQEVNVMASERVTGTEPISLVASSRSETTAYNCLTAGCDVRIAGVELKKDEPEPAPESEEEVGKKGKQKKEKQLSPEQLKKQREKEKAAAKKAAEKKKAAAKKAAEKRKKEAAKKKKR